MIRCSILFGVHGSEHSPLKAALSLYVSSRSCSQHYAECSGEPYFSRSIPPPARVFAACLQLCAVLRFLAVALGEWVCLEDTMLPVICALFLHPKAVTVQQENNNFSHDNRSAFLHGLGSSGCCMPPTNFKQALPTETMAIGTCLGRYRGSGSPQAQLWPRSSLAGHGSSSYAAL